MYNNMTYLLKRLKNVIDTVHIDDVKNAIKQYATSLNVKAMVYRERWNMEDFEKQNE